MTMNPPGAPTAPPTPPPPPPPPRHPPPKRRRRWLGWLVALLLAALFAAFFAFEHLPLEQQRTALQVALDSSKKREQGLESELERGKQRISESDAELAALKAECGKVEGVLEQTEREKQEIEAQLQRVQQELSRMLEPEILLGNVHIHRRGQELVVDLADGILFETGQAEVNERGKKVLLDLARTLAKSKTYDIQVAGHTDNQRVVTPETRERFPTNWELSTARATNVVRFLQDSGHIPGERLVAAGFAQFRPSASNASESGRSKNRRIEVLLQPHTADAQHKVL